MLKAKHERVLAFVLAYYEENGVPPPIRDVAAECDLSLGSAHRHITALTEAGYLERRPLRGSFAYWPTELARA